MRRLTALLLALLLLTGCAAVPFRTEDPVAQTDSEGAGHQIGEDPNEGDGHAFGGDGTDGDRNIAVTVLEETVTVETATGPEELVQARIVFDGLPETAEELETVDRTGKNGKFVTAALLIAAYKAWTPESDEACAAMMQALMESPSAKNVHTAFTRDFVRERMMQNGKWAYLADAYFDGASPENGYVPDQPLTVTLREYPYAPQLSTIYDTELYVEEIVTGFAGAETERKVSVYEDPADGKWYVFSDSYGGLLADIIEPEA